MNNSDGGLYFGSGIDTTGLLSDSEKIKREFRNIGTTAEAEGSKIDNTFRNIGAAAAGIFTIQAATGFITKIAQVRGEFQQLEVAFSTILRSKDKADKLMGEAVKLAAITPFTLQDVATGAKQLLAYGFGAESITKNLTMLGNVASGVSAPLGDIVYLYGTLQTQGRAYTRDIMQFTSRGIPMIDELSKVMKVGKEQVQGLVEAGKVGFPEVEKAMQNMTKEGGMFFNLMEEQSKTITGKISNLSDAFSRMYNDIGKSNEGLISGALDSTIDLVNNYQEVGKSIEALIITFGAYKAALMTLNAIQRATATAKYTDEAASLMKLLTAEQAAIISKKNLTVGSAEHVAAVRAEATAEMERQTQIAVNTQKELLAANESLAVKQKEQLAIQQNVNARRLELETSIASLASEKQVSLAKEISIASEIKAREALQLTMLKERESAALIQLSALEQSKASATVIAAKRAEIVAIGENIAAKKTEISQQEANIIAKRAEIVSIEGGLAAKRVDKAQNELNLAMEAANTVSIERNAAARAVSSEKAVIDSAVRRANTIETGINTAAQETNIVGTNILTIAKERLTVATARLNAFMMANPYILVAAGVALVAMAATLYLLRDRTTAAQKAQEEFAKEEQDAIDLAEEHKAAIDKNIDAATNQYNADVTRVEALNMLKIAYPEIFKKYDIESLKLADILKLKKEIAEIDSNEGRNKAVTNLDLNQKEIDTITARITQLKNSEFITEGTANQITGLEKRLEVLKEKSNLFQHKVDKNNADAWVDSTLGTYTDAQVKAEIEKRRRAIQLINNTNEKNGTDFKFRLPISGLGSFDKSELDTQISALENEQGRRKKLTSDGTKDIELLKKQIEDLQKLRKLAAKDKNLTTEERVAKEDEIDKQIAQKRASITTLEGGLKAIKAEDTAKKEAEARAKAQEEALKADQDFQRKQIDFAYNYEQERINLLEDSIQKEEDQNKLNYNKKLEDLKRQSEDELSILIKKAQDEYEAKGGKGIAPLASKVELPAERVKAFEGMGKLYLEEMNKANDKVLKDWLDKFKDYDQKRLDIETKYIADVAEANKNYKGDDLKTALEGLDKNRKAALQTINSDQAESVLKTSSLFIKLFGDASKKSVSDIRKIADESKALFNYLKSADPAKITDKVFGGQTFTAEQLKAMQSDPKIMSDIIAQINELNQTADEGSIKFGSFGNSIQDLFDNIGKGKNTIENQKKAIAALNSAFQDLSSFAGQATGMLSAMSKQSGDTADEAAKSIEDTMSVASDTMKGFSQGGIIGAVVSFAVSVATKIFKAEKEHNEALAKIQAEKNAAQQEYNDLLLKQNELLDKAVTIFSKDVFDQAMGYSQQADKYAAILYAKAGKRVLEPTYDKLGYITGMGSTTEGATPGSIAALQDIRIKTDSGSNGFLGIGYKPEEYQLLLEMYPKLIDSQGKLNQEQAESILNNQELDDTSKQALQSALDYSKEYDAAIKSLNDYLTSVFGSLGNDMMTAIVDNLGKSQDALDEFGKSASKTIGKLLEDIAFALFLADDFQKLSDDSKAIMDSATLTPEEKAAAEAKLMSDFEASISADLVRSDAWLSEWKKKNPDYFPDSGKTGTSQSAASQGTFQSMSQDTGNALEGRFTALQMIGADSLSLFKSIIPDIQAMRFNLDAMAGNGTVIAPVINVTSDISPSLSAIQVNTKITADTLKEQRNIALESMNHLADINKNTKQLYEMNERLANIQKGTDTLKG